jgi:hypothetical protein
MSTEDTWTYDDEIRAAIVVEVARWTARQCLGTEPKGTDRKGIEAKVRHVLANPHLSGNAPSLTMTEVIADEAEALAGKHMETDVNWAEWAFGL